MKKLCLILAALLCASQMFASYVVVLRDGTRYEAREKWTVSNGKALITLTNGSVLQLDPSLIDAQKSAEVNRLGLGNVKVLAVESKSPAPQREQSSLGSVTKLRKAPSATESSTGSLETQPPSTSGNVLGNDVISKFEAAYENVGIYEHNVTSPAAHKLRVVLTVDQEDRVFDAITATAFFMTGVARSTGAQIDSIQLLMSTTNGGAAGRFLMTRNDAEALNSKQLTPSAYFVQSVIY